MELYLEPKFVKKSTRFQKGMTPWNKGKKGFTSSDTEKRKKALEILAKGRKEVWKTRNRNEIHNSIPCSVYDLDGNYVASYSSITKAAEILGVHSENARRCVREERGRAGQYQFLKAEVVEFQGKKLVKKTPIEPYKRKTKKDYCQAKTESVPEVEGIKNPEFREFFTRNQHIQ